MAFIVGWFKGIACNCVGHRGDKLPGAPATVAHKDTPKFAPTTDFRWLLRDGHKVLQQAWERWDDRAQGIITQWRTIREEMDGEEVNFRDFIDERSK